jgi:hypothetical protein
MNKNNRIGSVLLFVIITIGVIVGMVSLSVGYAYNRARLIASEEARYSLRNKALNVLSQVMWNINADTNGFDCAVEGSMASRTIDGCEVTIEPANARCNFYSYSKNDFVAFVVSEIAPVEDFEEADAIAEAIVFNWDLLLKQKGEDFKLNAIEEFYGFSYFSKLSNESPIIIESIYQYFTTYYSDSKDNKLNINMFRLSLLPYISVENLHELYSNEKLVLDLQQRFQAIREKKLFFPNMDIASAKSVFVTANQFQSVTQTESMLLMRLMNYFKASSDTFYITVVARDAASSHRIECVYERGTGKIKRWVE